jgi:hypothetical protein
MGAAIRNAETAHAYFPLPASGRSAIHGKTLAVSALLSGGAPYAHAVLTNAAILIANLILLAGPRAAQLVKALAARTTLALRTLHTHAVGMHAVALVTDLAIVRAIAIGAVFRVTPPIGAIETGFTGHVDARTSLANTVDAHLTRAKAAHVAAVGGVAETTGTPLSLGAGHANTTALHALLVDTDLPIAGAFLGLAVDRVALSGRATLSLRTGHLYATGRQTFLVDTDLSDAWAIPPHAVFREAFPSSAGSTLGAIPVYAVDFHAGFLFTDESLRTIAHQAIEGQAIAAYDDPVLALVVVDAAGGTSPTGSLRFDGLHVPLLVHPILVHSSTGAGKNARRRPGGISLF